LLSRNYLCAAYARVVERVFKPVRKSVDSRASLLSRNYLFHRWPERELFFFSYWLQEASYASVSVLHEA
jgi:hypothetical protein